VGNDFGVGGVGSKNLGVGLAWVQIILAWVWRGLKNVAWVKKSYRGFKFWRGLIFFMSVDVFSVLSFHKAKNIGVRVDPPVSFKYMHRI
jgi:hypothetical protein